MMVKKYFALSLIAASLAVAGCSSSDDDDDNDGAADAGMVDGGADAGADGGADAGGADAGGVDAGGADAGGVDAGGADAGGADGGADGGTTEPPVEDMSTPTGTSILDVARGLDEDGDGVFEGGQENLTTLVAALGAYPDLLNLLDDEAAPLTVFAPSNAAFEAAGELDEDAVKNILQYHVAPQNLDATAAMAMLDTPIEVANGGTVTLSQAEDGSLQVTDNDGNVVALGTAVSASDGNASVYIIESVLAASEPVEGGEDAGTDDAGGEDAGTDDGGADGTADGGTGTGGGGVGAAGSTYRAIQDAGDLSGFLALVDSSNYQQSLQDENNNNFVTFAPTDGTFDPALSSTVVSYIHVRAAGQSGEIAAGTYNGTGGEAIEFTVAGEGETLTVNGAPATYVETQSGGALYTFGEE